MYLLVTHISLTASVLMSDVQAIFLLKISYSDNFTRKIEKKTKNKSILILID